MSDPSRKLHETDRAMDLLPLAALDAWTAHCADLQRAVVDGHLTPEEERRLRDVWGITAWYRSYLAASIKL